MDQSVNIAYTADTGQYMASMGEMITATARYGQVADGLTGRIAKVGAAVTKTAVDWATMGKSMNTATQTAAAYQQALSGLEARSVVTGDNFKSLGKQVREMARELPGGFQNAIQQVDALSKMGVTARQSLVPLARAMTEIGAANGELGPQLTQSFAQLNRTFRSLDVTSVKNIGASLTQVASSTGASASSIVEFSNAIAPLSQTLGMTKTQVLGFSAAFSRSGQDGYLAANVMNKMLGDMERAAREGTGELTTYATAVGKTTDQFAALVKSNPGEALTQVFDALSKGGSDSIRTLEKMGFEGPRAMKTLTAVAQAGGVREAISSSMAGYGGSSTQQAAQAAFGGLNDELSKTQESMTQLVEASGRPMLGFLENATRLANGLAGGFAKVANSDLVQTMMLVGTFGGGIVGMGTKAAATMATAGGIKQLLASAPGAIGGPLGTAFATMREHRGAMMMGGAGALGLGMMGGNSTLASLGGAALMLSNIGPDNRVLRGARRLGGGFWDMFYNQPWRQQAIDTGSSIAGVRPSTRYGQAFQSAAGYVAGTTNINMKELEKSFRGRSKDLTKLVADAQTALAFGDGSEQARKRVYEALEADTRGLMDRQNPTRNALISSGRSLGSATAATGRGALGMLGGFLGSGAGLATVGIGSAVGGYMMWQNYRDQAKQWQDPGFNTTRTLSEQYGIALAPVAEFAKVMSESVKTVDTWNEALDITGERANKLRAMYTSGDTSGVRMVVGSGASEAEVLAQVQAAGNSQSPAFMSALINDVAAQRGVEFAQRIADQVKGTQGTARPVVDAMGQIASDAERGWWSLTPGYRGQSENIEQVKGAADQLRAQQEQARMVGGNAGMAREQLSQFDMVRDQIRKQLKDNRFDEKLAREMAAAVMPADQVDSFITGVMTEAGYDANKGNVSRLASWAWNSVTGKAGQSDEVRAKIEAEANKPIDAEAFNNATKLFAESSKQYAQALRAGQQAGVTPQQMLSLWQEQEKSPYFDRVQNDLAPGQTVRDYLRGQGMTGQAFNAAQAVAMPENTVAQWGAVRPMMRNAMGNAAQLTQDLLTGDLSEGQRTSIINQLGMLQQYGVPQQVAGMGPSAARGARRSLALQQEKWARANPTVEGADSVLQMALQEQASVAIEEQQYLQQRARAAYDYRKQETRAWEDYYQERGWAQEDFQQSQAWAEEDYLRQRSYTLEDFRRQQRYAQEDFDKSMVRMAEDTAKGMINPWERMSSQGIWSLTGMTQNVEEQQRWLRDQLKALDELKQRGLSQQAIDTFGLADPGKAQQVSFYAEADDEEIKAANRAARRQARLGKRFSDPELNVSARRAVEDFEKNQTRARESLEVTLTRMDEAFRISTERAAVQFTKQMDRMATKMSKTMARMHKDFIDQDKEVIGNKRDLMRQIENVYENRTAKWGPIFGSAMKEIQTQNTRGWKRVTQDSDQAIMWIGGTWQKFSIDGTVPDGSNPFTTSSNKAATTGNWQASDNNNGGSNRRPPVSGTASGAGKQGGAAGLLNWGSGTMGKPGGGDGGPVSSAGGTGNWGADLKAKYTSLADALIKYGPLSRIGLIKGGSMKGGGVKAALWLWQQMLADGMTPEQAAGILGNLDQESGFSPGAVQSGGPGRGIAQWSAGGRWEDLLAFARINKMDPKELGTQYAFMRHEMSQGWGNFSMKGFADAKTPQQAADYFGKNYEAYGIAGSRNEDADYWYRKFRKIPAGDKKVAEKWRNAGLWEIGDEIVRRGKEYEKLLAEIEAEKDSRGWSGGTRSLPASGVKVIDGIRLRLGNDIGPTADVMSVRSNTNGLYYNGSGNAHSVGWGGTPAWGVNDIGGGGIPVYAYALGKVVHAGPFGGGSYSPGSTVDLVHLNRGQTRYAHMEGLRVRVGDIVQPGQRLGTSGSAAAHLHFEWTGMPSLHQRGSGEKVPWLALGGVATTPMKAMIAEAGHSEAVIPLNDRGVSVIAQAIGKYAMTYEAKVARTANYGTAPVTTTYIQDYSTQVNGPITVKSNDPDDMLHKLEAKQRRRNTYALSGRRNR